MSMQVVYSENNRRRILVTGCRHWRCDVIATRAVTIWYERHGLDLVVVHGAAPGVDDAFARACNDIGAFHEPHPANWNTHGKGAGPIRNAEMVALGASLCIAVHRDIRGSKGTKDCARRAMAAGIPTWLVDSEDGKPRRIRPDDLA